MPRANFTRAVKISTWERAKGCCEGCGKKLFPGDRREYDHVIPDAISKNNDLDNCQLLCGVCHDRKTKSDRKTISKTNRVRAKHIGAHKSKNPMPGSRNHPLKKKVGGGVVRRDTGEEI